MIRLRVLGGFTLVPACASVPSPAHRPRVLALLALLAGHGLNGISRDKLLAYLWPESDSVHARNSLKQALFSLRHTFGCQPLATTGAGFLQLDYLEAHVDLWEFEAAVLAGEDRLAAALYHGPFLDGFHVTGLAEFERWVEAKRQQLSHEFARTLTTLACRAECEGDQEGAVIWWRRLAAAEPLSAAPALGLMLALEAVGDPTAALDHGRRHVALVEAELGAPVSGEIQTLMRRLGFEGRGPRPVLRSWSNLGAVARSAGSSNSSR
jgi:DNA-binding SARP family transcriptional activator